LAKKKTKKKELGVGGPNVPGALDRQVLDGDEITIADAKQFVVDAKKNKVTMISRCLESESLQRTRV